MAVQSGGFGDGDNLTQISTSHAGVPLLPYFRRAKAPPTFASCSSADGLSIHSLRVVRPNMPAPLAKGETGPCLGQFLKVFMTSQVPSTPLVLFAFLSIF